MTTAALESATGLALAPPQVTPDQTTLIKATVAKGATDAELKLFFYDCARRHVHPLDKLIHFTKRGGKYTPITSIDFMRSQAADSGDYAGNDDAVFVGDAGQHPEKASVTVHRLVGGQRCAFSATARWSEYCPEDNAFMWKRMPHTMLGKCAEALALRKGFPQQLAGLYSSEEMDQAGPVDVTRSAPAAVEADLPDGAVRIERVDQGKTGKGTVYWRITDSNGGVYPLWSKTKTPDGQWIEGAALADAARAAAASREPMVLETIPGKKDGDRVLVGIVTYRATASSGMTSVSEMSRDAEPETVLGSPVVDPDPPVLSLDEIPF